MMGCAHSIPDNHSNLFKARNLNDNDKSVNAVLLEVQNSKLIVHSRNKKVKMASWPIRCLRRYGCNHDVLFIEAGSGCDTGQGMYLFKCARTEQIFDLLKKYWSDLQAQHDAFGPHNMGFPPVPSQTVISTTNQNQEYYNMNNSSGTHHLIPNGSTANYTNGSVRVPSTSSTPTQATTPAPRGSTSSQHGSTLAALPEEMPLRLETPDQPFVLQPAPTSRQEIINRRRINSDMAVARYSRKTDHVVISTPQRRNSESANYENNEVIGNTVQSGSFPRRHRVFYDKNSQKVKLESTHATSTTKSGTENGDANTLSPDGVSSVSRSMASLRSDCELLLTPGSKSSGIGSLNGNGGSLSSQNPPPMPPPKSDPWKRRPHKFPNRHISPSYVPHSAREYVNTANASLDVSGTPLPATAVDRIHFNFDFDIPGFPFRSKPTLPDRSRQLNYVPVEAFKNGDDFNCGASSASSGIPGTPRTPKTPKTPLTSHLATDYAIIDHNKTRALSNVNRARQRQRKSRHGSTDGPILNAA
ncbi:fibroblast growth factor receptor substrate 3-like [Clavelina lepadiformis]|uniref:IRS-type PTB domain-containing protein n=1 Tax=Clavelina lepadiformis TaxID=159417 RepID=A0ABP0FZ90_CLALP